MEERRLACRPRRSISFRATSRSPSLVRFRAAGALFPFRRSLILTHERCRQRTFRRRFATLRSPMCTGAMWIGLTMYLRGAEPIRASGWCDTATRSCPSAPRTGRFLLCLEPPEGLIASTALLSFRRDRDTGRWSTAPPQATTRSITTSVTLRVGLILPCVLTRLLSSDSFCRPITRCSMHFLQLPSHCYSRLTHTGRRRRRSAASLFKSWFVDFDPVVAKRDGKTPVGVPAECRSISFPATSRSPSSARFRRAGGRARLARR